MSVYVREKSLAWGGMTKGTKWLLIITCLMFGVQWFVDLNTWQVNQPYSAYFNLFALSTKHVVMDHYYWQLVTYIFLHGNLLHLASNMLCLLLIGPETERYMGTKHFVIMYFFGGVIGAAGWLMINGIASGPCVGASGAFMGVFGAFVALFPNRRVYIIILPMWPIRSWVLALILLVVHLIFYFTGLFHIAWDVHIAGGLAGFIYTLTVFRPERVPWGKRNWQKAARNETLRKLTFQKSLNEEEVDQILDKIADEGMGSLTRQEREVLQRLGHG